MKVAIFDSKEYDQVEFNKKNSQYDLTFFEEKLNPENKEKVKGFDAVCIFVNDNVNSEVIDTLVAEGIKVIFTRSAGFNQIDIEYAKEKGIKVYRVPAYSPNAIAEHAASLLLSVNRKMVEAISRTRSYDFSLNGLEAIDIHGKNIGVIGTGKIGKIFAQIMRGFGANVYAYDVFEDEKWAEENNITYKSLDEVLELADVISLHSPLLPATKHMINSESISKMKDGVILINSSRGGLINTNDLIEALHAGKFGAVGLDVYENEQEYFFEKHDDINDEVLKELLSFENVYVTAHQAFFTDVALHQIYSITIGNIDDYLAGKETNIVE